MVWNLAYFVYAVFRIDVTTRAPRVEGNISFNATLSTPGFRAQFIDKKE